MKNRKKRWISYLLLLLLAAGCGGMDSRNVTVTEEPDLEISIAWWGDENRNEYMQELLEIYEQQNPGISFRPVPLAGEEYEEYLAVTAAAGESPDIMQMDGRLLTIYERNHTLADWQDAAGEGIQKELPIDTALMNTGKRGNIQAGIPVSVSIPVMLYRPRILREAGVELPEKLDWKYFSQLCNTISRETDNPGLVYDHSSCDLLLTWMEQRGESLFREGNPVFTTGGKGYLTDYFLFCKEMFAGGAMVSPETGEGQEERTGAFFFGEQDSYLWQREDEEAGVMPLPSYEQKSSQTKAEPELYYSLSAQAEGEKREAAARFLLWLLDNDTAVRRTGLEKGIPASREARRLLAEDVYTDQTGKELLQLYEQLEGNGAVYSVGPEKKEEIDAVYKNIICRLYHRECSPQGAAAEFEQKITELFREPEGTDSQG